MKKEFNLSDIIFFLILFPMISTQVEYSKVLIVEIFAFGAILIIYYKIVYPMIDKVFKAAGNAIRDFIFSDPKL